METENKGFTRCLPYLYIMAGAKNVIMSCEIDSPNVKWEKDGKPFIPPTGVAIEQEGFVHKLIFTPVEYADSGLYMCISGNWFTNSSLFVGDTPSDSIQPIDYLAPQGLSRSENKNVFTMKCTDGSEIEFQTNNLEDTEQADIWFNLLTYGMHFPCHGTDEGVSVKVENTPAAKSGVPTKPSDSEGDSSAGPDSGTMPPLPTRDGMDVSFKAKAMITSDPQPGSQKSPYGETEGDAHASSDSEGLLHLPPCYPVQVSESARANTKRLPIHESESVRTNTERLPILESKSVRTNTERLPIHESEMGSIVQPTRADTNSPQTVPIIPPYNPHDRWGQGKRLYINNPMPRGVKCNRDMLMMSAVPSGMFAWRDTKKGSWLIACVKEELENEKKENARADFMSVLTNATRRMAGKKTELESKAPAYHHMKGVPVIEHQLLKRLIV